MVKRSPRRKTGAAGLADVARHAGVALATASYALRSHPKIPESTRHRVHEAARVLGYRVNATVGRLMAELRTDRLPSELTTIAWINCHPEREIYHDLPWLKPWLHGANHRASQLGWRIDEMWLNDPEMGSKRMQQILRTRAVPGLLIAPTYASGGVFEMECAPFAVATMARTFKQPRFHQAAADDFANTITAFGALRALGHRRIGFFSTPLVCEWTDRRQVGAFLTESLALPPGQRLPPLIQPEDGAKDFAAFRRWFHRWKPDAIITPCRRLYEWLEAMGVLVPDDCGLAHLNLGADVADWAGVDPQIEWIAASAVDILIGQIYRHETGVPHVPKELLIKGLWKPGKTVRSQR